MDLLHKYMSLFHAQIHNYYLYQLMLQFRSKKQENQRLILSLRDHHNFSIANLNEAIHGKGQQKYQVQEDTF